MSDWAKKAAGTYVPDGIDTLAKTLAWLTAECRTGQFARSVAKFCAAQPEFADPARALVEQVTQTSLVGRIPVRCFDHESDRTFPSDVSFRLDPVTRQVTRL